MSRQNRPPGRYGHVAVGYKDKVFIWGGRTKKYSQSDRAKLASTLDVFDLRTELWERLETRGTPPSGLIHCAFAPDGPHVYVYGGGDGETDYDTLHRLNVDDLTWTRIPNASGAAGSPGRKNGAKMVLWGKKLILFGGYGDLPQPAGGEVLNRGLNNELHVCTISEDGRGTWNFQPSQSAPPPCSHFSFVDIGQGKVAKYGGKEQKCRTDALYILSLHSWTWSLVSNLFASPGGKAAHTVSYLWGEQPALLVVGGLSSGDQVSDEAWTFNLGTYTWTLLAKSDLLKRYWHSSTSFPLSSSHVRVVLFGGIPKLLQNGDTFGKSSNMQNTIVVDLRINQSTPDSPAQWTSVLDSNLATKERLQANNRLFDSTSITNPDATMRLARHEEPSTAGVQSADIHGQMKGSDTTSSGAECTAELKTDAETVALDHRQGGDLMTVDDIESGTHMVTVGHKEDIRRLEHFPNDAEVRTLERHVIEAGHRVAEAERRADAAEKRAVEAEKRAGEAEKRAGEAEKRAARAEGKVADVEKWSCVLQAAVDSAMDRAKYWEDRAVRLEKMLAKASTGQGPSLAVVETGNDSDAQYLALVLNEADATGGAGDVDSGSGDRLVQSGCSAAEQMASATELDADVISSGTGNRTDADNECKDTTNEGKDTTNGDAVVETESGGVEDTERDSGDSKLVQSDRSLEANEGTIRSLQSHAEEAML